MLVIWAMVCCLSALSAVRSFAQSEDDGPVRSASQTVMPPAASQRMFGGTLDPVVFPQQGGKVLGFRATVELAPNSSLSYLPVSIGINALGTIPADRNLIFRFETIPDGYYPPRNGMTVDVPVTLAQGTKATSIVRYLPKWSVGRAYEVSVLEDGDLLPEYQGQIGVGIRGAQRLPFMMTSEYSLEVLQIRDASETGDTRGSVGMISAGELESSSGPLATLAGSVPQPQLQGQNRPQWPSLSPVELSSDWRAYQQYDAILITASTLQKLASLQSRFSAVRGWVLQGGTLVVFNVDDKEGVFATAGFTMLPESLKSASAKAAIRRQLQSETRAAGMPLTESMVRPLIDQMSSQLSFHDVGAGRVCLVDRRLGEPTQNLAAIIATETGFRASPMLRRGVDPILGNRRFFNWLIPGVAQPPVYTFMGLLTLFVVLVGPVAYRRTKKIGRAYLMFAIAPVLAFGTTAAMFGYGIVADGFGTKVRVRQMTWVDGVSGDAGERVLSTYFAGIRPTDGLKFDRDAEVYSSREVSGEAWEQLDEIPRSLLGRVELREDEQRFSASFLPSRQQRQFVSHRPRPNIGSIRLTPVKEGIEAPTVTNGFDFVLHKLVARDSQGNYWLVTDLQPGQAVACTPMTARESSRALGRMFRDHMPQAAVREQSGQKRNRLYTYDVLAKINEDVDPRVSMINGIFETWLQRKMLTEGDIPALHFVATADVSEDVVAVEDSEITESIRYVFGTLQ